MEVSIGIDIGGTKIAGALVDSNGSVLHKMSVPVSTSGQQSVITQLVAHIRELREIADSEQRTVIGIGVGTAGQIDFANGVVVSGTTNIQDWNDVPLRDELSKYVDLPIWVDNDVNVVALAETYLGAAKGHRDVLCLALGTGVGGGVITSGSLLRGAFGAAAELGHISIDMHGPACNCGLRGCLETYASGTAIARMMEDKIAAMAEREMDPLLRETIHQQRPVTSRDVFQLYHRSEETAVEVVETMLEALSFGIVSLIHTFNPTIVVLGGGVMEDGEWIRREVSARIRQLGLQALVQPVEVVLAAAGPDAGVIGAAYQSWLYNPSSEEDA